MPPAAPEEAERVSRAEPPATTLVGLKEATTPAGRPEAPNTTVWAEPAVTAVAIVATPDELRSMESAAGLAEMEKLATMGIETTRERGVVWVAVRPVPVITMA